MRVVIELKRGEVPEVVLNNLYKQTQLQDTFGINMVALIDGQPKLCNLKDLIAIFLEHRREVVTRRTVFELRKARERGHVLEGLAVALANIDEFIETIKASPTPPVAKSALMSKSWDSSMVREMLARVGSETAQGHERLPARGPVAQLRPAGRRPLSPVGRPGVGDPADAPAAPHRPRAGQDPRRVPRGDGADRRPARHPGDAGAGDDDHRRRAHRAEAGVRLDQARAAAQHDRGERARPRHRGPDHADRHGRHALAHRLRQEPAARRIPRQRRGGRGKQATQNKEDDWVEQLFIANTHDYILCFTTLGRVYWLKVWEVPQGSRNSRGRPIVNMFPLLPGEKVNVVLPLTDGFRSFPADHYVFMATAQGVVKKTSLDEFSNPRRPASSPSTSTRATS
jgi:DNA gyrase subunit A